MGSNADNVSAPFFKELNTYNKRKEVFEYPSAGGNYYDWGKEGTTLDVIASYPIEIQNNQYKISEILYQPVYYNNKLLFNGKRLRDSTLN